MTQATKHLYGENAEADRRICCFLLRQILTRQAETQVLSVFQSYWLYF